MPSTAPHCETCGETSKLVELTELGFGPGHEDDGIHLCRSCLEEREAACWSSSDPDGRGILDALAGRNEPHHGRYTYLQDDDQEIHLMRLRQSWVDRHAAPGSAAQA